MPMVGSRPESDIRVTYIVKRCAARHYIAIRNSMGVGYLLWKRVTKHQGEGVSDFSALRTKSFWCPLWCPTHRHLR
jgi:hypothetical protein